MFRILTREGARGSEREEKHGMHGALNPAIDEARKLAKLISSQLTSGQKKEVVIAIDGTDVASLTGMGYKVNACWECSDCATRNTVDGELVEGQLVQCKNCDRFYTIDGPANDNDTPVRDHGSVAQRFHTRLRDRRKRK